MDNIDPPNLGKTYEIWAKSRTTDSWSRIEAPTFTDLPTATNWAKAELERFAHWAVYRTNHTLAWGDWWK